MNLPYAESFNRSEHCTRFRFHNLPLSSTHNIIGFTGAVPNPILGIVSPVVCLENISDQFGKASVSVG